MEFALKFSWISNGRTSESDIVKNATNTLYETPKKLDDNSKMNTQ